MKALYFLFILIVATSCGKKSSETVIRRGVDTTATQHRGYNLVDKVMKCLIQPIDIICTSETSPEIDANQNFAKICNSKGKKSYDCNCKKEYICSEAISVSVEGYNYNGEKVTDLLHKEIIICPSAGVFTPPRSDKLHLDFQTKCEGLGYEAILVGCNFKQVLCSQKI